MTWHYSLIRKLVRLSAEFFFSKKYLVDLQKLNTKKPLLVCANHASTFLDAMLIMVLTKRTYHVLVRADVFQRPWAKWFLSQFNLIPIYRMRDGINQLEKNNETFERCLRIFENNGAIIIFPEANCVMERKLRKLQKGAARIAFQAEESNQFKLDLEIISVGITYERMKYFGGRLYMKVSDPFSIAHYKKLYQLDKNEALLKVTQQIESSLKACMTEVLHKKDETIFEHCLAWRKEKLNFEEVQSIAHNVNLENEELKNVLAQALHDFDQHLQRFKIRRATFVKLASKVIWKRYLNLFIRLIDVIALFPFFLIGLLFNGIPFYLPLTMSKMFFKNEPEYHNSINMAGSVLLFILFYITYAILLLVYSHSIILSTFVVIFGLLCGMVAFFYRRSFKEFLSSIYFMKLKLSHKKEWYLQYKVLQEELAQF